MEKEKTKKPVPAVNKKPKVSMREYFKGIRTETKKVVWPTRKELVSYTGVVLLTCFVLGLGIWVVDSAFLAALKYALNISF
ncbi:preprotein translocase subunit SecE [Sinanaerobacter chloroacetimidivorans]|jgi:preprotein translocase subunit SecE|uniref:Protein translocase subunit SecE n=1 Tax=Sinanaerobacter chloroacetimidivorans TaxID=2818044 RepID=A0A8J7W140_9FIRM|nr:preprotein translocase subunit SecE [Sinanaerobacter chloroacetimidivorans]MBR0597270.1 preprotein translocase subunit SecE [Sinanaerobacter chloroacetimidivorans]